MKLVLKHNRYYVESRQSDVIQKLLKDTEIQSCLVEKNPTILPQILNGFPNASLKSFGAEATTAEKPNSQEKTNIPEDIDQFYEKLAGDEDDDAEAIKNLEVLTFEIRQECIEIVQKRCIELEYPLLAEYDFRNDTFNPSLKIDLKPATTLRFLFL